jgi:hypothetical protein
MEPFCIAKTMQELLLITKDKPKVALLQDQLLNKLLNCGLKFHLTQDPFSERNDVFKHYLHLIFI